MYLLIILAFTIICFICFPFPNFVDIPASLDQVFIICVAELRNSGYTLDKEIGLQINDTSVQFFSLDLNNFGKKTKIKNIPYNQCWDFYKQSFELPKSYYNFSVPKENIFSIDNYNITIPEAYDLNVEDLSIRAKSNPCLNKTDGIYQLSNSDILNNILKYNSRIPFWVRGEQSVGIFYSCVDKQIKFLSNSKKSY